MFRFLLPSKSREVLKLLEDYNKLADSLSAVTAVSQTEDVAISLIRSGETILDDMIVVLERRLGQGSDYRVLDIELDCAERKAVQSNIPNNIRVPCSSLLGDLLFTNVAHYKPYHQKISPPDTRTVALIQALQARWKLYRCKGLSAEEVQRKIAEISLNRTGFTLKKTPFWEPLDTLSLNVMDKTFTHGNAVYAQITAYIYTRSYYIRRTPSRNLEEKLSTVAITSGNHTFLI